MERITYNMTDTGTQTEPYDPEEVLSTVAELQKIEQSDLSNEHKTALKAVYNSPLLARWVKDHENSRQRALCEKMQTDINKRFDSLQSHIQKLKNHIVLQENTRYDGSIQWKIPYSPDKEETSSLYSPPFYTSCHGYKVCLRVYPNGDGEGKWSHFSAFFCIMRGQYDSKLTWPFNMKVTIKLIDQKNGTQHITQSFIPEPQLTSFKKPVDERNVSCGFPQFIPLNELKESQRYIADGIIEIHATVEAQ